MAASASNKRSAGDCNFLNSNSKKAHWSQGLLKSMNDTNLCIEKDEKVVIIKDKYPKAKHHYLILPFEHIADLKALKPHHNVILHHMEAKAMELAGKYPETEFRYGYHAIPSMSQLHLHMISQDFDSPCLKTKKHWNSFNTRYFMDSSGMENYEMPTDVLRCLEEMGMVVTMTPAVGQKMLEQPLKCHKCSYSPSNMPKLKLHLAKHFNK